MGCSSLAVLVERWVSIKFVFNVSSVKLDDKAYIHWDKLPEGFKGNSKKPSLKLVQAYLKHLKSYNFPTKLGFIDSWFDGIASYFACMWLLQKKSISITIIIALFVIGVLAHVAGLM